MFGPSFLGDARERPEDELRDVLTDNHGTVVHGLPWFAWDEHANTNQADELQSNQGRRVAIVTAGKTAHVQDDDQGAGIITILLQTSPARDGTSLRRWAAAWVSPLWTTQLSQDYRFTITKPDGSTTCSQPFAVTTPLPPTRDAIPASTCP